MVSERQRINCQKSDLWFQSLQDKRGEEDRFYDSQIKQLEEEIQRRSYIISEIELKIQKKEIKWFDSISEKDMKKVKQFLFFPKVQI